MSIHDKKPNQLEYALIRMGDHDENDGPVSLEFAIPLNDKKSEEENEKNVGAD